MSLTKLRASKQLHFDDNVDINAKKLTNLAEPTADGDAATKLYVDNHAAAADAMIYKGTIGVGGTYEITAFNALATYTTGWSWRVITAGTIKGAVCENGDLITAIVTRTGSGNLDSDFSVAQTNLDGAAIGAASSTDNAVARFDNTTGKLHYNSNVTIDDSGSINIPAGQAFKINGTAIDQDDIPDGTTYKQYSATDKTKLAGIEASADVTDAANVGSAIHGATAKASLVDGDKIAIIDSEAANVLKTSLWSVIKSTLKTYFDTLYAASSHTHSYLASTNLVVREVPTGTLNGSNVTFTLGNTPTSGTEMLFVNGILMNAGAGNDYTITGTSITMATAPISTDVLLCTYWK